MLKKLEDFIIKGVFKRAIARVFGNKKEVLELVEDKIDDILTEVKEGIELKALAFVTKTLESLDKTQK